MNAKPLVQEITNEAEHQVALEWRDRLRCVLDDPSELAADLDDDTRDAVLKSYQLHLDALSQRIEAYEGARHDAQALATTDPYPSAGEHRRPTTGPPGSAHDALQALLDELRTEVEAVAETLVQERGDPQPGVRDIMSAWEIVVSRWSSGT